MLRGSPDCCRYLSCGRCRLPAGPDLVGRLDRCADYHRVTELGEEPDQSPSSKALPPRRPMKKPYSTQMIASSVGGMTAIACDTGEAA